MGRHRRWGFGIANQPGPVQLIVFRLGADFPGVAHGGQQTFIGHAVDGLVVDQFARPITVTGERRIV